MRRRSAAVLLLLFASAIPSAAQTPRDLGQIPFEELVGLGVQRVFGASDRLQPVTEAPSSVTIVTADEISRYGYRTLADILRGVRGFYVTDDRNYSYVGARGFNRPGDYSTRVLLLVNGHRVNDNVFDQASVGADFGIDTAMFERVEVIRGPASSLYGTNALFAIVNVVTRTGASLNGASFDVDAGTLGTELVRGSAGRRLGNGIDFALSGTYERRETADRKATVSAQYVHALGAARLTTEASIDHFRYDGVYPYPPEESPGPSVPFIDGASGLRWSVSSRVTRPLPGRQTLTVGGEFVDNVDQNQWGAYPFASSDNFSLEQSSRQGAAYVQDEIRLQPWLIVNAGLRHDRLSRFNRTTPRGAVIVMPSANHSLKYLYGRAFRAPNAYELYYYRDASAYLQPESIDTHEWVWEAYFGERVRTAVSTYRYKASQLVDLRVVAPDAQFDRLGFANDGTIRATELELESEIRLMPTCHVLYLAGGDLKRSTEVVGTLKGVFVLTVSDTARFAQTGGMVELFVEDGRMRFAVNVDALQRARVRLSSRVLTLAKIVRDGVVQ